MAQEGLLAAALAAALALPASCDLPRDPEGTIQRVAGDRLTAIRVAPALTEAEAAALAALAQGLGAEVVLRDEDIHEAVAALRAGTAEVALGAIPADSPHAPEAAATRPVGRERFVLLLPPGENALLLAANRAVARAAEAGP